MYGIIHICFMDSGIEDLLLYSVNIFLYSVFLYGVSTVYQRASLARAT